MEKLVVLTGLEIESSLSEIETILSKNAVDSKTRPRPSKNGLETGPETKTNLEYYNTGSYHRQIGVLFGEATGFLWLSFSA